MLDGTVKTVLIDESQPVANLMVVICTKIGEHAIYIREYHLRDTTTYICMVCSTKCVRITVLDITVIHVHAYIMAITHFICISHPI